MNKQPDFADSSQSLAADAEASIAKFRGCIVTTQIFPRLNAALNEIP